MARWGSDDQNPMWGSYRRKTSTFSEPPPGYAVGLVRCRTLPMAPEKARKSRLKQCLELMPEGTSAHAPSRGSPRMAIVCDVLCVVMNVRPLLQWFGGYVALIYTIGCIRQLKN
jgi:hypothetical protein